MTGTLDPQTRAGMVAVLETAAARLRDTGWVRGQAGPRQGPNCVVGAIQWARAVLWENETDRDCGGSWNALVAALWEGISCTSPLPPGRIVVSQAECVYLWNDNVCPDGATAADALLNAAKKLAGAGETAANGSESPGSAPKAAEGRARERR